VVLVDVAGLVVEVVPVKVEVVLVDELAGLVVEVVDAVLVDEVVVLLVVLEVVD
jgi:hypothetical protein